MKLKGLKRPDQSRVPIKDSPDDYTSKTASDRVLYINLGFIKYGTNDKTHAASIFLSLSIITLITIVIVVGLCSHSNQLWLEKVLSWLQTAFMFIAGVAIGKSISNRDD